MKTPIALLLALLVVSHAGARPTRGLGVSFGDTPLVTQSSDVGALFPGANPIALGPIEIGDLLADFDANRAQAHAWVSNPFPGPDGRVHVETISFFSDGTWASFVDAGQVARSGSVSLVSWPDNALTVQFSLADDLPIATLLPPFTHFVLDGRLFTAQ